MQEAWKPTIGYETLYEVSNLGRVYSCRRGHVMKQRMDGRGYYQVNLWTQDGKKVTRKVHQLVATAFIGDTPVGQEVCHGPLGPTVNYVTNLSYGTHSKNSMDRLRDGTVHTKPIQNSNGQTFKTLREAACCTNIDQGSINKVLRGVRKTAGGLTWKYTGHHAVRGEKRWQRICGGCDSHMIHFK